MGEIAMQGLGRQFIEIHLEITVNERSMALEDGSTYAGLIAIDASYVVCLPCRAGLDTFSLDPWLAFCFIVCLPLGACWRAEVGCVVVWFLSRLGTRSRARGWRTIDYWAVVGR